MTTMQGDPTPATSGREPDDSRLSRRMWISIAILVLAMIAILIMGYMTFSRYVDFVK